MKVLGISPLDQDATVAIVEDGEILYAAAEERFTRVKQQPGFPWQALEAGLEATGTRPEEIERVVYAFLPWAEETRLFSRNLASEEAFLNDRGLDPELLRRLAEAEARVPARSAPIPGLTEPNERLAKSTLKRALYWLAGRESVVSRNVARLGSRQWASSASEYHRRWQEELEAALEELGLLDRLQRHEHHSSHAANAYLASGFERALIVTLDGYGSGLSGSVGLGEGGAIRRLHDLEYPHSLGTFYESVTSALGFRPSRHEGKIVGLAAYGDPSILGEVVRSRFVETPGSFRIIESNNVYFSRHLAVRFPKIDVAAAYQWALEQVATAYVAHWRRETGATDLVLSGGVAANVKLNQRLYEIDGVERVFVYPNMGDGGCGTGLALLASLAGATRPAIEHVYLGPAFGEEEIRRELEASSLSFERPRNLAAVVAQRIHAGEVVARFDGRMEYGPRALGNRSILYHAREPAVNQWLNQRLGRTEFMPFAPVTLFEARDRCYERVRGVEHAAEFMTVTLDCTEWMKGSCPASVHVDGTARPQLLRRSVNPGFYDIVSEYEKLSGIPCLINTSFNMHEEPIVCTPHDALRAFLQGRLDALAIGPFFVSHPASGRRRERQDA